MGVNGNSRDRVPFQRCFQAPTPRGGCVGEARQGQMLQHCDALQMRYKSAAALRNVAIGGTEDCAAGVALRIFGHTVCAIGAPSGGVIDTIHGMARDFVRDFAFDLTI